MELLLIIGVMVAGAALLERRPAAAEETQHIVVVQARPRGTGCMPVVMFALGVIATVIALGGGLAR